MRRRRHISGVASVQSIAPLALIAALGITGLGSLGGSLGRSISEHSLSSARTPASQTANEHAIRQPSLLTRAFAGVTSAARKMLSLSEVQHLRKLAADAFEAGRKTVDVVLEGKAVSIAAVPDYLRYKRQVPGSMHAEHDLQLQGLLNDAWDESFRRGHFTAPQEPVRMSVLGVDPILPEYANKLYSPEGALSLLVHGEADQMLVYVSPHDHPEIARARGIALGPNTNDFDTALVREVTVEDILSSLESPLARDHGVDVGVPLILYSCKTGGCPTEGLVFWPPAKAEGPEERMR